MKTLFLLVLLTRNSAGDINASFVNTVTLEQCQQKALMVAGVFLAANIPVIARRCITSSLRFTDFNHASSSGMIRYFYLVHVDGDSISIEPMPDWRSCKQLEKQGAGKNWLYCVSSVQSMI